MKLLELFDILEARVDYLRQQWSDRVNDKAKNPEDARVARSQGQGDAFEVLVNSDPTPNKQFLQWLIKLYLNDQMKLEDAYKAVEYLNLFTKHKQRIPSDQRDINRHKSLQDLYAVVKPHEEVQTQGEVDKETYKKMHSKPHAEVLYNDKELKIVHPLTKEASCFHGTNTKWCTASTESYNAFESYNKRGPLHIVLHKPTNRRWQLHFEVNQFMNEEDRPVKLIELVQELPKLREIYGDKIDEAIVRQDPDNIMLLENPSMAVQDLAVELKPELAVSGAIAEPTDSQRLSAIGAQPKLAAQLMTTDEEHRYEEMRDTVQGAESREEVEHGVGSIEYLYKKRGLTPDLLLRIKDAFYEVGSEIQGYSLRHKAFIGERWDSLGDFVKGELGEMAQYAYGSFSGENPIEAHYVDPQGMEMAFDALPPEWQKSLGQYILDGVVEEGKATVDTDGVVWLDGDDEGYEYDPTDFRDIRWILDETGDPLDMWSGFTSAAYFGEERGIENAMYEDWEQYIQDLEPEMGDNADERIEDIHAKIHRSGETWDNSPVYLLLDEKNMISLISEMELENIEGEEFDMDGWAYMYDFPDLQQPHYGWGGFSEEAGAESLMDWFHDAAPPKTA